MKTIELQNNEINESINRQKEIIDEFDFKK